jgi:PAS domain S-box-containing protein
MTQARDGHHGDRRSRGLLTSAWTKSVRGYVVAVLLVAMFLALRMAFQPWFGPRVTFLQFFPGIFLAAWWAGFGPGLVATALSAVTAMAFLLPPDGLAVGNPADIVSLAVFVVIGGGIAWLNGRVRSAAAQSEAKAERLDAIIKTSADGIIVIDTRGVIESFNPGAERMFGYSAAEVVGRNVSVLMPSPHHEEHAGYVANFLATGHAKIIGIGREVQGRRQDGTTFPLHLSVAEMHLGGQRKFTGMLHDLSERAKLKGQLGSSEARWRAVIESAVDGIIVIDTRGVIESFNPGAERMFGYSAAEVVGRNVNVLMPSPYHEEHDSYLSLYVATGCAKIIGKGREVTGLRKDGTTFPLHLAVGEITVGGERKFTGIVHDLTARVKMEAQLREQASLAKLGEMAAVVAHEVKNPLAGIRGAIQVLRNRTAKAGGDVTIMGEVVNRIDALDRMMKDLLLFARPPQPRRASTDIVPLVASTATLIGEDPAFSGIDIEVLGSAPPVFADADMLKVVFQNLLMNSGQAMQGAGRIRVAVSREGADCAIVVSDDGPGIPADVREKIFTPFFTTKSRGSGLGLPTVKRLIEAHDGEVTLHCPPAGGTTVIVRLPVGS